MIMDLRDTIVRVTLGSICTSDLHIKHVLVSRPVLGVTAGHEMVGVVEPVNEKVSSGKSGNRVTVNVETFCAECFFCKKGYVNNCADPNGGWAMDGGTRRKAGQFRRGVQISLTEKIPDSMNESGIFCFKS